MSAAEKMSRRDEMETLLPFYLNGSLEGAELEAVEEWLSSDPVAMAALGEAEAEFSGTAAANPRSMRKGETAAVGSTLTQPSPGNQTSDHACASDWRTTT